MLRIGFELSRSGTRDVGFSSPSPAEGLQGGWEDLRGSWEGLRGSWVGLRSSWEDRVGGVWVKFQPNLLC